MMSQPPLVPSVQGREIYGLSSYRLIALNRKLPLILILVMLAIFSEAVAQKQTNSSEARRVFDKAYEQVFGPQGSSFGYDVNVAGLYHTRGTIWMKGKQTRFYEEKVDGYNDGTNAYMVFKKKKVVEIHAANSDKKDKYSGKFKFSLDDFDYSMSVDGDETLLTLRQRKNAKGTIKEVKATLDSQTLAPKSIKVKVLVLWANIRIDKFKAGGISAQMFAFPRSKYSNYKIVDKR